MKLTKEERDALPDRDFALAEVREYPIHDIEHARAALSLAKQHATPEEYAKIEAAIHKRYPQIVIEGERDKLKEMFEKKERR